MTDNTIPAPEPRIIRTRDELAALDPDTLVAMNPITKGHATSYVWSADTALRVNLLWHAPLVIIATGDTVRAARQALEAANDLWNLPVHRTEAGYPNSSTCDGGGCPDCTDPA